MALSRKDILRKYKDGTIVIDPFDDRRLKTVSYDVTLGPWYWREKHPATGPRMHNMYDAKSVARVWSGPFEAAKVSELRKQEEINHLENIPDSAKVILLGPGETILGHTVEFIGGRKDCVAKMYARSSMGRNFIEVCKDAGWGDVGYINRWTMEITNNSQHFTIPLVVGRRVAQMVFHEVSALTGDEDYALEAGKYQTSSDLKELKHTWSPHQMIPRMNLDWEIADEKKAKKAKQRR